MINKSTMLGLIFFSSLFLSNPSRAENPTVDATQFVSADCGDGSLQSGDYCIDSKGYVSVVKGERNRNAIPGMRAEKAINIHRLTKRELAAFVKGQAGGSVAGNVNVCNNGSDCATVRICADGGNNCNSDGSSKNNNGDGGNNNRGVNNQNLVSAYKNLVQFCYDLPSLIADRSSEIPQKDQDQQKVVDDAFAVMKDQCRDQCIDLSVTKKGKCVLTADEFKYVVSQSDVNKAYLTSKFTAYYSAQELDLITQYKVSYPNAEQNACELILKNKDCAAEIQKDDGLLKNCTASANWIAMKKKQAFYSDKNCRIESAIDVNKKHWDTASVQCLTIAQKSCSTAIESTKALIAKSDLPRKQKKALGCLPSSQKDELKEIRQMADELEKKAK